MPHAVAPRATLRLFGGVAIETGTGPLTGQIVQRRRLAFLAILGAAHRMPVSRDRVVALLWPDLDAEGARHRLSDCLYVVRRALGEGAAVAVGDDLRLDETLVDVDVRAFERALDEGAADAAVALHGAPFLDGFHLTEAPEFEAWVDGERARLAGRLAQALQTLAGDAERRGDWGAAVTWLRRIAADDRLATGPALRLIQALANGGDVAGALRHARVHQAIRHAELGLGEDPEIVAAAERLAAGPLVVPPVDAPAAVAPPDLPAAPPTDPPTVGTAPARPPRRSWRRAVTVGGAVLAMGAAGLAWSRHDAPPPRAVASIASTPIGPTEAIGVAVFPFVTRGRAGDDVPGDAIASLLATRLDGGAGLRSIDPNVLGAQYRRTEVQADPDDAARLAERVGARYFVLGDVVHLAGAVTVGASLYDAAQGTVVSPRIEAAGAPSAVFQLVDSLAARLLLGVSGAPAPSYTRTAALTTGSFPALKAYLTGEARYRRGRYAESIGDFEQAVAIDSTFALAYYRLASAREWTGTRDPESLARAMRFSGRLPERVRLLVRARAARREGQLAPAESLLRQVTTRYPDEFEGWYGLGELLFHDNPPRGRSGVEAREALERAAALDPGADAEPLFHLLAIAVAEHRRAAVDSLAVRFSVAHPQNDLGIAVRAIAALASNDSGRIAAVGRELATTTVPLRGGMFLLLAGISENAAGTARLVRPRTAPSRPATERVDGWTTLAQLAVIDADWRAADSLFALAADARPAVVLRDRARLASIPALGAPPTTVRAAREALDRTRDVAEPERTILAAMLALRLGDLASARHARDLLASAPRGPFATRQAIVELTARVLLADGRAPEALALLESPAASPPGAHLRFLRAEVLEQVGRRDVALGWYLASAEDYDGIYYRDAIARAVRRLTPRP